MVEQEFYKQMTLYEIEDRGVRLPKLPDHIGIYKVESLLNKGSMSLLYLGLHPDTKEPLTIKVLSENYLQEKEVVDRFLKEAEIIELTNHPNIIKLYGHGRWEGGLYIAMEFVQGLSLREMILQQAMPLRRALEIVIQIAHALLHLHSHGIIHRDLKPENILLTAAGGIKVIDFGIAALFSEEEKKEGKKKKRFMGTPAYMSKELLEDPTKVSFASDIYALGVITYELILGRLSYGILHLSQIPKGLQKILAKTLQPKPEERYQDIVDFTQDLSFYLSSEQWKKDMRGADYLGELNENLREAQALLIPKTPPLWVTTEISLASNNNTAISSVYFDFFDKASSSYTVVLGESIAPGVEGLISIALLRGMVRSLMPFIENPKELIAQLNERLLKEEKELSFSFAYLTLFPHEERFSYISCGYSPLWYIQNGAETPRQISSDNLGLGIAPLSEIFEIESNWKVGDSVILHTFQAGASKTTKEIENEEQEFLEALIENFYLSPKQQVEAIFRKVSKKEKMFFERPLTIISLARTA